MREAVLPMFLHHLVHRKSEGLVHLIQLQSKIKI